MMFSRTGVFLAFVGVLAAAPACDDSDAEPAPVVLVHGAWMGQSAWDDVAADLRAKGGAVATLDLPAHGDDATPAAEATIDGYADAVVEVIAGFDQPVVLVGHSMAGVVISAVAEREPENIARLVFVAAYRPADGQALVDLAMQDHDSLAGASLMFRDDGTVALPEDQLGEIFCADCSADALERLLATYRDEPAAPFTQPVTLTADRAGQVPATYVFTSEDRAVSPALQQAMVDASPVDTELTLATSHAPMLSAPAELAALLVTERERAGQ